MLFCWWVERLYPWHDRRELCRHGGNVVSQRGHHGCLGAAVLAHIRGIVDQINIIHIVGAGLWNPSQINTEQDSGHIMWRYRFTEHDRRNLGRVVKSPFFRSELVLAGFEIACC